MAKRITSGSTSEPQAFEALRKPMSRETVLRLRETCAEYGVHTSTHGAPRSLTFDVGTSGVEDARGHPDAAAAPADERASAAPSMAGWSQAPHGPVPVQSTAGQTWPLAPFEGREAPFRLKIG